MQNPETAFLSYLFWSPALEISESFLNLTSVISEICTHALQFAKVVCTLFFDPPSDFRYIHFTDEKYKALDKLRDFPNSHAGVSN